MIAIRKQNIHYYEEEYLRMLSKEITSSMYGIVMGSDVPKWILG